MKRLHFHSFRQRLNAAFLAVSLAPLLLFSALLLQIFRFRMTADQQQNAQQQLSSACHALNTMQDGILSAAESLQRDGLVTRALAGAQEDSAKVYSSLYTATAAVRSTARFDLYSADGTLLYSTQAAPGEDALSPDWGILYEAAQAENGTLVYSASEDPTDPDAPVLRAAARLTVSGKTAGFLVAVMYEQQLREALDGMAGAQNELLVMDRFWHGIYCTKPAQVQTLASALRSQLLAGKALTGFSDDFLYTARQDSVTGLYLVLQQPQVFTRGTLRLLYTVSALCALGGAAVSIFLSLQLSRQMFRPIGRLHDAISQVGQNDLQVQVAIEEDRHDELSELAQQFNRMVLSLRRNQQALLENQQALNDAQIRMLQAQLNPHFLCNTLDTMKWISKINQVPQVALMSTNLADILRFCISPDEFVPLEKELRLTRRCLEIIANRGFGLSVLTKSDLILRDMELLCEINRQAKCVVQMTLTTWDAALCGALEPNVCNTQRRLEALRAFHAADIATIVWLCPILPFLNDTEENLRALLAACAEAGVYGIITFGFGVTLREGGREYFYRALDARFPGLKDEYVRRYGNAYVCESPNSARLTEILRRDCARYGIRCDTDGLFAYLRELPARQVSLFASI